MSINLRAMAFPRWILFLVDVVANGLLPLDPVSTVDPGQCRKPNSGLILASHEAGQQCLASSGDLAVFSYDCPVRESRAAGRFISEA